MTTLEFAKSAPASVKAGTLLVFARKGADGAVGTADAVALAGTLGVDLGAELAAVQFDGSLGQVARIPTRGKAKAPVMMVSGLGGEADDLEALRKASGTGARNAAKDESLAVVLPADVAGSADDTARAQAVSEGVAMGAYAFTRYRGKSDDQPSIDVAFLVAGEGVDADAAKDGVATGSAVADGTCVARDLVNTAPADKRPPAFADRVGELVRSRNIKMKVFDEDELAKGGFGGILGVGRGSSEPPRLVELTYAPRGAKTHVTLVGKGITFDSGGLSLKPSAGMTTMKSDMAGAAAVVGTLLVADSLGLKVKITGLLCLAENMPSGTAIRVGDVLTHRNGATTEVLNTDAEGRLVLADGLAYGAESTPDAMIDVATLTGAQIVALGNDISGLMGSDQPLIDAISHAADTAGEAVWQLPLPAEYRTHLDSSIADMKNIGRAREAGTIVAGLFLKEFAGDTPWAHLDIAGPSFSEEGDAFYRAKGGTGAPVRTLVAYLRAAQG